MLTFFIFPFPGLCFGQNNQLSFQTLIKQVHVFIFCVSRWNSKFATESLAIKVIWRCSAERSMWPLGALSRELQLPRKTQCSAGEFPSHQRREHHMLSIISPQTKRRANDVRENGCNQSPSWRTASPLTVSAFFPLRPKNESGKGGLGGNLPEQGRACQCQLTGPWRKKCGLAEQFLFLFLPLEESQLAQLPSERSPDSITEVTNDRLEDSVSSWMEAWKPSLFGQTHEQNLKNRRERTTLLYQQCLISVLPIFSKCSAFPKINMQYLLCRKT